MRFAPRSVRRTVLLATACCLLFSSRLTAEDWPMHRKDRLRSAVSSEQLKLPLKNVWMFRARVSWHAPALQTSTVDRQAPNALFTGRHAWFAQPIPDGLRWALPITSAGDSLFFTSHDGRIVCLSAESGEVKWEYLTGAAVTQAANYCEGRVYAGSDDGHVYCLDAQTGALIWRHRAAPADEWLISYGRMASRWPVRTDVMVEDGVAYFACGVFPHDGVYVHAIHAETRAPLWQPGGFPHSGDFSVGIAGYPVLTKDKYHCPVALKGFNRWPMFRRNDGVYDWHSPDPERSAVQFGHGDGRETRGLGLLHEGVQYTGTWARRREQDGTETMLWSHDAEPGRWHDPTKVVLAGETLFYLADDKQMWGAPYPLRGEGGTVIARRASDGERLWSFDFPERPHDILVANGRLFVSTRNGTIYCFAPQEAAGHGVVNEPLRPEPPELRERIRQMHSPAEKLVQAAGTRAGFAVVLDCQDGALAYRLAMQTDLYIVAVFADEQLAQLARRRFALADLHGSRIAVWHGKPGGRLPVPSRTADLVTSEATVDGGPLPAALEEVARMLKPIRGTALFLAPQATEMPETWQAAVQSRTAAGEEWTALDLEGNFGLQHVRPPLPDSGGWAGSGGGPGNTNNSHDAALKGPLGVAWYGGPSVSIPTRSPPLLVNGVLLCPVDQHTIAAHDQYNGRLLWQYSARGLGSSTIASGVAGGEHLYVIHEGRCLRFDLYEGGGPVDVAAPFEGGAWSSLSVSRDGETLWGGTSLVDEQRQVVWAGIFAVDIPSGHTLWSLGGPAALAKAKAAGDAKFWLWHGWNAISDGRVYIVTGINDQTRRQAIDDTRGYLVANHPDQVESFDREVEAGTRAFRTLIAIDARTGERLYDHGIDMTHTGVVAAHAGYVIAMATQHVDRRRKNPMGGPLSHGLGVWDGATGKLVWKRPGEHSFTPVITADTIYAEPWAYDLKTGNRVQRIHPVNHRETDFCWARKGKHCGGYNGSEHFLFGRNMGIGYYDTLNDNGMYTFWHSRVACSTDVATGGGMMIKPPYALGCTCAWSLPFTVAMAPAEREPEASFEMALPGEALPVRHVRFNFGAEGERRDRAGNLWLRPGRRPHGQFTHVEFLYTPTWTSYPGVNEFRSYVRRSNVHTEIENTDLDFVFACGERAIQRCVIPLHRPEDAPASYTIRLGFCGLPGDAVGGRVFDIRLNGDTVERRFDALAAAGGADRAIWKEYTLDNVHEAVIEFITADPNPSVDKAPILNAIEIIRHDR